MHTNYYVFLYTPGPNWLPDQPIHQQPLAEHFQYMSQLEAEQTLVLGGAFLDNSGAMGVLHTTSLREAQAIVQRDPAVLNNIVHATVHAFYITVAAPIGMNK